MENMPSPDNAAFLITAVLLLIAAAVLLCTALQRAHTRRLYRTLNRMLDSALDGRLRAETFDESLHSALENRFHDYLTASETSADQIREERARIREIISDISHQTKTPISNILLYTELLSEQELSDAGREYVRALTTQTVKLRFLIESLVKMSRLESEVFLLEPRMAPLAPMFDRLHAQFALPAERKGLSLVFEPTALSAVFDEKWTTEAVGNLLDNAVKYTERGSVTVSAVSYEMFCCIRIADTGMGIPEEELPRIFSRFHRSPDVHDEEGLGIGLYLSREIVSREDGYIKVSSTPGAGSVFSVYLPTDRR